MVEVEMVESKFKNEIHFLVEETLCVELEHLKEKYFMEMEVEEVMVAMVVKVEMDLMEEIVEKEVIVNSKFHLTKFSNLGDNRPNFIYVI
jgi:hypothetical protein